MTLPLVLVSLVVVVTLLDEVVTLLDVMFEVVATLLDEVVTPFDVVSLVAEVTLLLVIPVDTSALALPLAAAPESEQPGSVAAKKQEVIAKKSSLSD